ncbi:MAG: LemA family protein, partial [Reinekea sp.]|nr:LemA family protein [Reinekea sp.]
MEFIGPVITWGVPILIIVFLVAIYNKLVAFRNRFKNAFAQIDVQLQRRHDLIPNLVETAKAYLKHEKETLENVISARNQAVSAQKAAAADPTDLPTEIAAGLLLREGRIWIQQRSGSRHLEGYWEFPGGKVEPGETPEEALRRELDEEVGVSIPGRPREFHVTLH